MLGTSILGQISILSQIGPSVPNLAGQGYQIVKLAQNRHKICQRQYLSLYPIKILGLAKNPMSVSPEPALSPLKTRVAKKPEVLRLRANSRGKGLSDEKKK